MMSGITDIPTVKAELIVPNGSTIAFDIGSFTVIDKNGSDNKGGAGLRTFTFERAPNASTRASSSNASDPLKSDAPLSGVIISPDGERKSFTISVIQSDALGQTKQTFNSSTPKGSIGTYSYTPNGLSTAGYTSDSTNSLPIMIISGDAGANLAAILTASPQVVTRELGLSTIAQSAGYTVVANNDVDVNGWVKPQAYTTSQSVTLSPVQTVAPRVIESSVIPTSITTPSVVTTPFTSTPLTTPSLGMFGLPGSSAGAKLASSAYNPYSNPLTAGLTGMPIITSPYISTAPYVNSSSLPIVNLSPVRPDSVGTASTRRADIPAGYGPWGYVPESKARSSSDNTNAGNIAQYTYQVADFTPLSQPMTVSVKTETVKKETVKKEVKIEENKETGEKEKVETTTTTTSFTPSDASKSDKKSDTTTTVTVRSPFVDKKMDEHGSDEKKTSSEADKSEITTTTTTTTTSSEKPDENAGKKDTLLLPLDREGGVKLTYVIGISLPEQKVETPNGSFNVTYGSVSVPIQEQGTQTAPYTLDPSSVMNASVQDVSARGYSIHNPSTLTPSIYDLTLVTPTNVTASFDVTPGYGAGVKYMH